MATNIRNGISMQPMRSRIMVYKLSDKGSMKLKKLVGRFHQIEKIVEMEFRSCSLLSLW